MKRMNFIVFFSFAFQLSKKQFSYFVYYLTFYKFKIKNISLRSENKKTPFCYYMYLAWILLFILFYV